MNKSQASHKITEIFEAWKRTENFPKNIQDLSLDDLPFSFRKQISLEQEKFLDCLLSLDYQIHLSKIGENNG